MTVGETGVGEMGVGETGQIIGETGVGETGVGEMGVIPRNQHSGTGMSSLILSSPLLNCRTIVYLNLLPL